MKYWNVILFGVFAVALIGWTIYCEFDFHYLLSYNGVVIEKQQILPKKMPDLLIKGTKEVFPTWKWEGINFDSVKLGDSIVKKRFESDAYYFKKVNNGKFIKIKLRYWTHLF